MILDLKYVIENGKKVLYAYMPKLTSDFIEKDGYVEVNLKQYEWRRIEEGNELI